MSQLVRLQCPGCQNRLKFPADRVNTTVPCPHCGKALHIRLKTAPPTASASSPAAPPPPPSPTTRSPRRWTILAGVLGATVLIALLIAGAVFWTSKPGMVVSVGQERASTRIVAPAVPEPKPAPEPSETPNADLPADLPFPRRLLAISVNNYVYANPVCYGSREYSVHALVRRLIEAWHIPEVQALELSDSAPEQAQPPLKAVVEKTTGAFLETSRPVDRVVLLWIGHAVVIEGSAYLVPLDGELARKETLISLGWLYEQLAQCRARQKVLILDVCRFDPTRGRERPDGGAMNPALDGLLAQPPAGVQVWSACLAGQQSYEGTVSLHSPEVMQAGIFAIGVFEALGAWLPDQPGAPSQHPNDPLPVEALARGQRRAPGVNAWVESRARTLYQQKQTPRLVGQERPGGVAYDPHEPAPPPVAVQTAALPAAGAARPNWVAAIWREIVLPPAIPLANATGIRPLRPEILPLFPAKMQQRYRLETGKTPLREAVRQVVRRLREPRLARAINERLAAPGNMEQLKRMVLNRQEQLAALQADVEDALDRLMQAGSHRGEEPEAWRATYDFILGALQVRLVLLSEYNYALGQVRKDALPPWDPARQSGWRLAWQERPPSSGSDARKRLTAARKLLLEVAQQHPGTPWEVLARREAVTAVGLEWQASR